MPIDFWVRISTAGGDVSTHGGASSDTPPLARRAGTRSGASRGRDTAGRRRLRPPWRAWPREQRLGTLTRYTCNNGHMATNRHVEDQDDIQLFVLSKKGNLACMAKSHETLNVGILSGREPRRWIGDGSAGSWGE
jgi:hypothetical protein